jgi:hypothetical protein
MSPTPSDAARAADLLTTLDAYRPARQAFLAELGLPASNRDPFAEFSEQFVAALTGGTLATSRVQAGHDLVLVDGPERTAGALPQSTSIARSLSSKREHLRAAGNDGAGRCAVLQGVAAQRDRARRRVVELGELVEVARPGRATVDIGLTDDQAGPGRIGVRRGGVRKAGYRQQQDTSGDVPEERSGHRPDLQAVVNWAPTSAGRLRTLARILERQETKI